ncbi:peptidoglycan-binding domain-containing protein [Streptomyces drozdowiczii]|uniref:Peptidoglycan-binding protein n=1 Tax=Streptomyces drozdowiczii TaxID=202862 RepID=A0ABY6PTM5_9ACTN|nr:peptidoglycan-binding domain-containing protein [Streptomyces drozdowiczii]MCX0245198.1 peptidoglycan-binding protein [Streptomyces drozdowiczii]UZK55131.1 peptidoglycan-binding protein [Streptomyces drozdowiczii]
MIKTALRRGAVAFGTAAIVVTSLAGVAQADVGVPYVKPDQRGTPVLCVQRALELAGYNLVRDGVYGQATYAALTDFQRRHGLSADGIVGPRTGDVLYYDYLKYSGGLIEGEVCPTLIPTTH